MVSKFTKLSIFLTFAIAIALSSPAKAIDQPKKLKDFDITKDAGFLLKCFSDGSVEIWKRRALNDYEIEKTYKSLNAQTRCVFAIATPKIIIISSVLGFEIIDTSSDARILKRGKEFDAHRFAQLHKRVGFFTLNRDILNHWDERGERIYSKQFKDYRLEDIAVSGDDKQIALVSTNFLHLLNDKGENASSKIAIESVKPVFPYVQVCGANNAVVLGGGKQLYFQNVFEKKENTPAFTGDLASIECSDSSLVFTTEAGEIVHYDILKRQKRDYERAPGYLLRGMVAGNHIYYGTDSNQFFMQEKETASKPVEIKFTNKSEADKTR